jgi:hypothetical protein
MLEPKDPTQELVGAQTDSDGTRTPKTQVDTRGGR